MRAFTVALVAFVLAPAACRSTSSSPLDVAGGGDGAFDGPSDGGVDAAPTTPPPLVDGGAPADGSSASMPPTTAPVLLLPGTALYPRVIRRAVGAAPGTLVASVVAPQASGRLGGTILVSHDDGFSFVETGHIDDPVAAGGLCCATLFELPRAVGGLAAGTLLWAASVGGDTPAQPMSIPIWSSADGGATWTRLGTVVTAAVPRRQGGLWEPELSLLADGTLVCHYSDETDPAHSQKLVEARSSDGVTWGSFTNTVALATVGERPGMANVRALPGGRWVMSYEICGVAGDDCTAHLRTSSDGWNWGDATDLGLRPATVDGMHFAHAPTLVWADQPGAGRLYLVGQMVYDGAGNVAPENGGVVFANTEGGVLSWFEIPAPVPIAAPYNNFCPNYSSSIVPLDGGQIGLEIATGWDGSVCRAWFARGALGGSGDAAGVANGGRYRLVDVESSLCLDVSGGSTAAGDRIQQWTCNGLSPQDWTFRAAADGSFAMQAQNSGLCLAVVGGASTPGAGLEQQPCDGGAAQSWTLRNVGVGSYTLTQRDGALCLDDSGGSTSAGTLMQLWSCNQLSPQIWQLEPQ